MIEAYWWEGMRQPAAGYGGTLWIEGRDLAGPEPRVYFGAAYLPVREVLSDTLLGVDLAPFRPAPRTARSARVRLQFRYGDRPMQVGPVLTLRPEYAVPDAEILRYTTVGHRRSVLTAVRPYAQLAVHLSFLPEVPPRGVLQWGAHRLDLLGMDHDGTLFVQVPPGTPAGAACVCLREPDARPIWGPPLHILPLGEAGGQDGRETPLEP